MNWCSLNGKTVSFFLSLALLIFKSSAQIRISIILLSQSISDSFVISLRSFEIAFNDFGSFLRLFSPSLFIAIVRSNHIASGFSSMASLDLSVIELFTHAFNCATFGITSFVEYVSDSTITLFAVKLVSKNLDATFPTSLFCSSSVPVAIVADVPIQRMFLFFDADLILRFKSETSAPCLPLYTCNSSYTRN